MFSWGKNLINGFFEDPLGSVVDAIKGVIDAVINPIRDSIMNFWGEILKAIYMIWATLASILDTIQVVFNMMVGTSEVVWQSTSAMGKEISAGSMSALGSNMSGVTHNLVLDVFLSEYVLGALFRVVALSLFLLLIFTLIAIVKKEYSTPHNYDDSKQHNASSKRPIIGQALKSLLGFVLIPLCCIFGVIGSGVLMQALDGATSPTKSTVISNKIFAISAFDANRVRTDDNFYISLSDPNHEKQQGQVDEWYNLGNGGNWNPNFTNKSRNQLADYIDDLFIMGTSLQEAGITPKPVEEIDDQGNPEIVQRYRFEGGGDNFSNYYHNGGGMNDCDFFNTKNASQVFYFYDLHHFQWLIGFFTVIYMVSILIRISFGAAGRLFELAILFVVSPAILAMAPLDGANAQKEWSKQFVSRVGMIYAPVVALNLYFILVAVLVQLDFTASVHLAITKGFGSGAEIMSTGLTAAFIQQIFNLFILIAGLQVCENAIDWLGNLIGAKNIDKAGGDLRKGVSDAIKTSAAGKYLLDRAGKARSGIAGALAGGMSHFRENRAEAAVDRANRDITHALQMQREEGYNSQIATHQENVEAQTRARDEANSRIAGNEAKLTQAHENANLYRDEALQEDINGGKVQDYFNNYDTALEAAQAAGFEGDAAIQRAKIDAMAAMGDISADSDQFQGYMDEMLEARQAKRDLDADRTIVANADTAINTANAAISNLENERDNNRADDFARIQQDVHNMDRVQRAALRRGEDVNITRADGSTQAYRNIRNSSGRTDGERRRRTGTYTQSREAVVNANHNNRVTRWFGNRAIDSQTYRVSGARIRGNRIANNKYFYAIRDGYRDGRNTPNNNG